MSHRTDHARASTHDGPASAEANDLVESHLYLVQHVVNQLASRYPRHIDRGELWSAGASGLVDASRRYDPDTGVPFARYATIRIRGAIIDSTRTRDWATRSLRRDMREIATTEASFEQEHGRSPSSEELAATLGISAEEVDARRDAAANANLLHLDQRVGGDDGEDAISYADLIPERDQRSLPEDALEQTELLGTVRIAVRHLPETQREVVERYFFDGDLLRDIAADLGVTEARVSQIRSEALHAVQAYFASAHDEVPEVPASAPGMRRRAAYVAEVAAASTWRSRVAEGHHTLTLAEGA